MSASMPDSSSKPASASAEPIAIIGMACRFPGANDIEAFWRLLETGGNAVVEGVPGSGEGRWGQIFGDNAVQRRTLPRARQVVSEPDSLP